MLALPGGRKQLIRGAGEIRNAAGGFVLEDEIKAPGGSQPENRREPEREREAIAYSGKPLHRVPQLRLEGGFWRRPLFPRFQGGKNGGDVARNEIRLLHSPLKARVPW